MADRTVTDRADPSRPNSDQTAWVDIPTAAARLGMTSEAIRQRIKRGTLAAEKRDGRWYVAVDRPNTTDRPTERQSVTDQTEPLEAAYRVTPEQITQAIEATSARYVADMETVFDRVDGIYRELVDELRRRAETAEVERETMRTQLGDAEARLAGLQDELALIRLQTAQGAHSTPMERVEASEDVVGAHEGATATARPWWAFWRR